MKQLLILLLFLFNLGLSYGQGRCDSTFFEKAQDLQDEGKFDKAADLYNKQNKLCPTFIEAYINKAVCYFNLGKIDKGRQTFDEAIFRSNNKAITKLQIAEFYFGAKLYDTAFNIYKSVLLIDSNNSKAYFKMGRCKWLKRIQELKAAHQADDYAADTVFTNYLKDEILGYYSRAIYLDSVQNFARYQNRTEMDAFQDVTTNYEYYFHRAFVKQNFYDYKGALKDYDSSLAIHVTINTYYWAAYAARKVGENEKACEYIQRWGHTMSFSRDESYSPQQKIEIADKFCKELNIKKG